MDEQQPNAEAKPAGAAAKTIEPRSINQWAADAAQLLPARRRSMLNADGRPPRQAMETIAQGWARLPFAATTHWVRYDGSTLCRMWTRDDMVGGIRAILTEQPDPHARACRECRQKLEELRRDLSRREEAAMYAPRNKGITKSRS